MQELPPFIAGTPIHVKEGPPHREGTLDPGDDLHCEPLKRWAFR